MRRRHTPQADALHTWEGATHTSPAHDTWTLWERTPSPTQGQPDLLIPFNRFYKQQK